MVSPSSKVERLLSAGPTHLPLIRSELRPEVAACDLGSQDAAVLFPDARHGQAALAGLLLRVGCWEESHAVAQNVAGTEGSYWHAIVHRMEPDPANATYWFQQAGKHAIFPELYHRAAEILNNGGPEHWRLKASWDPLVFIEWCKEASEKGGSAQSTAIEIQMAEWHLLFDWCAAPLSRL